MLIRSSCRPSSLRSNVVISEFFIRMNQLKEMVKHERRRLADSKAASQRAAAKAAAAKRRHGTATNFFFTVLRSRAGIGPGVTAPDDWNRIDSDGARGVVPSWPKPPKSKKDARKLQGEHCCFLDFVGIFLLNLPYTHREIDCLLSRFHGTNREIRD
eukprot:SAG31_NODE_837_length_11633_cov_18.437663_5_plen_157_part_00